MNQSRILTKIIVKNTNSNNINWQKIERKFNHKISHYDAKKLIKKYPNDQDIKELYEDLKMFELRLKYLERPDNEDKFKTTINEQVIVVDNYLASLYVNDIKIEINSCDYQKIYLSTNRKKQTQSTTTKLSKSD